MVVEFCQKVCIKLAYLQTIYTNQEMEMEPQSKSLFEFAISSLIYTSYLILLLLAIRLELRVTLFTSGSVECTEEAAASSEMQE